MIPVSSGVRVWLATGHTDMRKGFASLSLQVQEVLRRDPLSGQLFCFRGRRGNLLKVIWHDGQGAFRHGASPALLNRRHHINPVEHFQHDGVGRQLAVE
jgi:transposase